MLEAWLSFFPEFDLINNTHLFFYQEDISATISSIEFSSADAVEVTAGEIDTVWRAGVAVAAPGGVGFCVTFWPDSTYPVSSGFM